MLLLWQVRQDLTRPSDSALRCGRNQRPVLGKHARGISWLRRFPLRHALPQDFVADFHLQYALPHIEVNDISVANRRNRPAQCGYRGNVASHKAVSRAAKATVGE